MCRNQIISSRHWRKDKYFKTYFQCNKKGSTKIWFRIRSLINTKLIQHLSKRIHLNKDRNTVTDSYIIANQFINFFTSSFFKDVQITQNLKIYFNHFLKKRKCSPFLASYHKGSSKTHTQHVSLKQIYRLYQFTNEHFRKTTRI